MKNKSQIMNDSDKNLSAVMADKEDVIIECKRQYMTKSSQNFQKLLTDTHLTIPV